MWISSTKSNLDNFCPCYENIAQREVGWLDWSWNVSWISQIGGDQVKVVSSNEIGLPSNCRFPAKIKKERLLEPAHFIFYSKPRYFIRIADR
jgi:hypothetical protein